MSDFKFTQTARKLVGKLTFDILEGKLIKKTQKMGKAKLVEINFAEVKEINFTEFKDISSIVIKDKKNKINLIPPLISEKDYVYKYSIFLKIVHEMMNSISIETKITKGNKFMFYLSSIAFICSLVTVVAIFFIESKKNDSFPYPIFIMPLIFRFMMSQFRFSTISREELIERVER